MNLTEEQLAEVEALIAALSENLELDEEQLDELKRATLASYIKKASAHAKTKKKVVEDVSQVGDVADHINAVTDEVADVSDLLSFVDAIDMGDNIGAEAMFADLIGQRVANQLADRKKEIAQSMFASEPVPTDEEVVSELVDMIAEGTEWSAEDLQELKKSTLQSYREKAGAHVAKFTHNAGGKGASMDIKKVNKRAKGVVKAKAKLQTGKVTEEVEAMIDSLLENLDGTPEQLQELKKGTLNSYLGKWGDSVRANVTNKKKIKSRVAGAKRAEQKLGLR